MSKKVLVISGSPRRGGNTDILSDEFIRGAEEAGHETEEIFIRDKKVNGCLGCLACQKNAGVCIQKDDMDEIGAKMLEAAAVVLAAPVYFNTFNAQMKTVLDRTVALRTVFRDKTAYLISAGQAPGQKHMASMHDSFRKYIGCFPNIREGGAVFGYGASSAGDVKDNPAMRQAYEMGKQVKDLKGMRLNPVIKCLYGFRHECLKLYRRLWYTFRVLILEKPRGLDFHLRNKQLKIKSGGKSLGYAITPESHLKQIFSAVEITGKNSFIDIGCGKGYVVTKAAEQPYNKITGIDIVPELIRTAQKNLSVLKLENRVNLCLADATTYNYDDYDHFFLYNPFSADILKTVVRSIIGSLERKPRSIIIIYFHPSDHRVFDETGYFEVSQKLYSFIKGYETYIYKNIKWGIGA
jgi:multimeric flavodoxin WrbA/SAM-dependent methyltransferase